jgi:hypothetical protein
MSEETLLVLVVVGMILAFALGIWIGLGYPGLYDKYEQTGKAPRVSPFAMLVNWLSGGLGRRRPPGPSRRSRNRRRFLDRDRRGRR